MKALCCRRNRSFRFWIATRAACFHWKDKCPWTKLEIRKSKSRPLDWREWTGRLSCFKSYSILSSPCESSSKKRTWQHLSWNMISNPSSNNLTVDKKQWLFRRPNLQSKRLTWVRQKTSCDNLTWLRNRSKWRILRNKRGTRPWSWLMTRGTTSHPLWSTRNWAPVISTAQTTNNWCITLTRQISFQRPRRTGPTLLRTKNSNHLGCPWQRVRSRSSALWPTSRLN